MLLKSILIPAIASLCANLHFDTDKTIQVNRASEKICTEMNQITYAGSTSKLKWDKSSVSTSLFRDIKIGRFEFQRGFINNTNYRNVDIGTTVITSSNLSSIDFTNAHLGEYSIVKSLGGSLRFELTTLNTLRIDQSEIQDLTYDRTAGKQLSIKNSKLTNLQVDHGDVASIVIDGSEVSLMNVTQISPKLWQVLNSKMIHNLLTDVAWNSSVITKVDFVDSNWTRSSLSNAVITGSSFRNFDLNQPKDFSNTQIKNTEFSLSRFTDVAIDSSTFENVDFKLSRFTRSETTNTLFKNVNFRLDTDLSGLSIGEGTHFENCTYDRSVRLPSGLTAQQAEAIGLHIVAGEYGIQ